MPDLLPCPFCGSTKLKLENLGEGDDWFVSCAGCEVQQIANYLKDVAVKRWNQRAVSTSLESTPVKLSELLGVDALPAPPATETQPDELLSTLDEITEALNTVSASAVLAGEGHDGRDAHNIYKIVCRTTNKVMWVRGILAKEPPCKDCNAAARIAYSDATTPGFFSAKCPKHRAGATGTQPSYEWQCMNCSFVTRDEQRAADHQTTMTPLHAYRRITLGATEEK